MSVVWCECGVCECGVSVGVVCVCVVWVRVCTAQLNPHIC